MRGARRDVAEAHRTGPSAADSQPYDHALGLVHAFVEGARSRLQSLICPNGKLDAELLGRHQHLAHGLAWLATYRTALEELLGWARRIGGTRPLSPIETKILSAGFAEYLAQIAGGIPMSAAEFARPADFGLMRPARAIQELAARFAINLGSICEHMVSGMEPDRALDDDALDLITAQFRRFVDHRVTPFAHQWHLDNAYIPESVLDEMAALGVFALTIPEEFGGAGLGKLAMCLTSEELSRGYIGVGSLGTRSEIAAELIRLAGTHEQKARYLPRIASGEIIPTAVFTEPDHGSDLASLGTRARLVEGEWRISGSKTWITHGARSDLMTLMARTSDDKGYRGLSIFLAEKPRGGDADPFPAEGMTGTEIEVLGYRGMKEFEIAFSDFRVPSDALLGGVEGAGFKQLMETFESARIQTAARAVGVAQNALELGLSYAEQRVQFGHPLTSFPRIADKLGWMAAETMISRQLCYAAARAKDAGRRCDIEAGMAKLLAARVAWTNADCAVQIHGGNGFALEFPISRVLCDARILSIFEGAAEIQAQVIARGLLGRSS